MGHQVPAEPLTWHVGLNLYQRKGKLRELALHTQDDAEGSSGAERELPCLHSLPLRTCDAVVRAPQGPARVDALYIRKSDLH